MTKTYIAEVPVEDGNYHKAAILAEQYRGSIEAAGGLIDYALDAAGITDLIRILLPDDVNPVGIVPTDVTFSLMYSQVDVPVVEDHEIASDRTEDTGQQRNI